MPWDDKGNFYLGDFYLGDMDEFRRKWQEQESKRQEQGREKKELERLSVTYQIKTFGSEDGVNKWLRENSHRIEPINIGVYWWSEVSGGSLGRSAIHTGPIGVSSKGGDVYVLLYRVK